MGRFSEIAKGTLARHVVELPLANGVVTKVAVRPLLDWDDNEIDAQALVFARKHGVEDPKPGQPIYERAVALYTLLLACSDPDSPDNAPVPFFDSVEQIQKGVDRDRIAWLMGAQQVWEDRCSPRQLKMTPDEFIHKVGEVALTESEDPFLGMRPGMQWDFTRTLCGLFMSSPELKSLYTSLSSSGTSDASSESS
jgi:hypothetical protein